MELKLFGVLLVILVIAVALAVRMNPPSDAINQMLRDLDRKRTKKNKFDIGKNEPVGAVFESAMERAANVVYNGKILVPGFRDKFQLMNKTEMVLFNRLLEAVPECLVFSQVSMSQMFHIQGDTHEGKRQLEVIGKKSVDFLICRKTDSSIVAAIELNGPTHDTPWQQKADQVKRDALNSAGIPLIVFYPDDLPSVAALGLIIETRIGIREHFEEKRNKAR